MSEEFLYWFGFSPLILNTLFIFYLLFKRQSWDDRLFSYKGKPDLKYVIDVLRDLEIRHGRDYSEKAKTVLGFYLDKKLTSRELDDLEKILISAYFDSFRHRWIAFTKADPFLKFLFFYAMFFALVGWNILMMFHESDYSWLHILLYNTILLIVPFLFGLITLLVLVIQLAATNIFFPTTGAVGRAGVCLDEMLKSLKIGGRTARVLPPHRSRSWRNRYG